MTQMTLGAILKQDGQRRAATRSALWLRDARSLAEAVAHATHGAVSTDDLRDTLPPPPSPAAWGCVFKDGWKAVGWTHSQHPSNHHRAIRLWRMK